MALPQGKGRGVDPFLRLRRAGSAGSEAVPDERSACDARFRIGGCGPRRGRPGRIFGDLLSHGPSPGTRQRHVLALRDARYRFQGVGCGLEPDMHMGQDEGSAHGARVLFFQYPFRSRRPRGEAPVGRIACRAYPGRSGRQISGALHGRFQRSCRERTGRRDEDRTARCPRGVADACVRTSVQLCRIPRSGSREAQEPHADRLSVRERPRAGTDLRLAVRLGREESSLGPFPAARRDRIRLKKKSGRFRQASVSKCEDCLRNA